MSERVSRTFRGSVSVLFFSALAVGGISFGYLTARSRDAANLTSQVDAQSAPAAEPTATANVLARVEPVSR